MNEKVRSRVYAAEMGPLRRISGLTMLDMVKSADIRECLNIELLLLRPERSQLRWYGHVTLMSQEKTAKKLLCSSPIGQRPEAVPELDGEITLKILVSLALASQQSICPLFQKIEMCGGSNWSCCPRNPPRISGFKKVIK